MSNAFFFILIGIAVLVCIFTVYTFNRFVTLRARSKNALHQIDVQLERRSDLIPNLVETVKGYVQHERGTLETVIKARSTLLAARHPMEKAETSEVLTQALKSLFAVAESYPQLKANENFLRLQEEIATTENQISFSRQFYNDSVMQFNTGIQKFPNNLVALLTGFRQLDYFILTNQTKNIPPKVRF